MERCLHEFWLEDDGQDLMEYTLLISVIALICAALVAGAMPSVTGILTKGNNTITSANSLASGS